MNTVLKLVIASALAGVVLGAAVAYLDVRPWAVVSLSAIANEAEPATAPPPTASSKLPRAEFAETTFHFGNMERGAKMAHAFKLRNTGDAPLTVKVASTTCKCTVGELANDALAPGEESEINLEWTAKTPAGPFRHGATIETNDPQKSRVELVVEGQVVESTSISPPEILFSNVPLGESRTADVFLMSNLQPEVKVLEYKFSDEKLGEQFGVEIVPAEKSELPVPTALGGVKVAVTFRAGQTIGQTNGWLELTTDLEKSPTQSVYVSATTVGDISVYGPGWAPKLGLLNLGLVRSGEGKQVRLNLAVRGAAAQSTNIEVLSTDPPALKATVGERQLINDQLAHLPLIVEIPKGSPPMVRTGEPASTDAQVVLKSNHPHASEVQLRVHFTVEP